MHAWLETGSLGTVPSTPQIARLHKIAGSGNVSDNRAQSMQTSAGSCACPPVHTMLRSPLHTPRSCNEHSLDAINDAQHAYHECVLGFWLSQDRGASSADLARALQGRARHPPSASHSALPPRVGPASFQLETPVPSRPHRCRPAMPSSISVPPPAAAASCS
jgi:hypothetical protein